MPISIPVLISGAGPTGLSAALILTELSIPCIVIEKCARRGQGSNALIMQAKTLEIWSQLGLLEQAIEAGHRLNGLCIYNQNKHINHLSFGVLNSPCPFVLGLPQSETEKMLLGRLKKRGCQIYRNMELISCEQNKDYVEINCQNNKKETIEIKANWVLECDGSQSKMREILQIPVVNKAIRHAFIIADIPKTSDFPFEVDYAHAFWNSKGFVALIPLKSGYRAIFEVTHENSEYQSLEIANVRKISEERLSTSLAIEKSVWISHYGGYAHLAKRYQQGRVFLLGDAAHSPFPIGWHGINTGIQDAYNLSWKLAMIEKHQAKINLLTSYEIERRPAVQTLMRRAHMISRLGWLGGLMFKWLIKPLYIKKKLLDTIFQLAMNYEDSPIMGEEWEGKQGLQPGVRISPIMTMKKGQSCALNLAFASGKLTLLVFSGLKKKNNQSLLLWMQCIKEHYGSVIDIYWVTLQRSLYEGEKKIEDLEGVLHQQYGAKKACYYLIRPDGYVAFRSSELEEKPLRDFLHSKLGMK